MMNKAIFYCLFVSSVLRVLTWLGKMKDQDRVETMELEAVLEWR